MDIGQHNFIGGQKSRARNPEQIARAREAVRLKCEQQTATRKGTARGHQHCIHLHRMVTVVVDERERASTINCDLAVALEAAAHATERGERARDGHVVPPASRAMAIADSAFNTL